MGAHILNAVLRLPTQFVSCLTGIGPALGNVAGAAGINNVGQFLAAGLFKGMNHIQNGIAMPRTQIVNHKTGGGFQLPDGADMPLCKIHHMNIIADSSSVRCRIIITKHMDFFQFSHRDLGNIGHQIVGDAVGVFSYQAGGMRADRIEVTKQRYIQLGICFTAVA